MSKWNKINRYRYSSPKGVVRWAWKGRWAAHPMEDGAPDKYGLLFPTKEDAMSYCDREGKA